MLDILLSDRAFQGEWGFELLSFLVYFALGGDQLYS